MTAHWKLRLCTIGASAVRCDFTEKEAGQVLIEGYTGGLQYQRVRLDFSALVHGCRDWSKHFFSTRGMGHWLHLHFSFRLQYRESGTGVSGPFELYDGESTGGMMIIIIREPLVVGNTPTYCCCPQ